MFSLFDFSWDYVWKAFAFSYLCWVLFLAIMNLARAKDNGTLPRFCLFLGYPLLALGLFLDVVVNFFVFSLITLDFPRELLTTAHLDRLIAAGPGWRQTVALFICQNMLDVFDPHGPHCKCEPTPTIVK